MVLVNLNNEGIKVPSVLIYSEVTVINSTKHSIILDEGYRTIVAGSSCPANLREGEAISVSLGAEAKEINFKDRHELYFFLKLKSPQKKEGDRVHLKAEIVRL
jgi:hypothetical protein